MNLRKSALSLCVLVLAAGALTLLTPLGLHAVASALVEITNTTANPAITQGIDAEAGQQVDVACYSANPGSGAGCAVVSGGGLFSGPPYTLPANMNLIVTGVDIQPSYSTVPSQCASITRLQITTDSNFRKEWYVSGSNTTHFDYPSGFVLAAGQTLQEIVAAGSACPASIEMHGFLTAN